MKTDDAFHLAENLFAEWLSGQPDSIRSVAGRSFSGIGNYVDNASNRSALSGEQLRLLVDTAEIAMEVESNRGSRRMLLFKRTLPDLEFECPPQSSFADEAWLFEKRKDAGRNVVFIVLVDLKSGKALAHSHLENVRSRMSSLH